MKRPARCPATLRDDRCELPSDHQPADIHRAGKRCWGSRNEPEPFVAEWVRRMRERGLPTKEFPL